MGRGTPLTAYEKGLIDAKKAQGFSIKRISKEIGRSRGAIANYVSNPAVYGTKKSPGRPSLLSDRDKRRIIRRASNSTATCSKIRSELSLPVSSETRALKVSIHQKTENEKSAVYH